jgi:hypothetical protein
MQSEPITTDVSLNMNQGDVYNIIIYVIKFVSELRQVGGFLRFPPPIKLTPTNFSLWIDMIRAQTFDLQHLMQTG